MVPEQSSYLTCALQGYGSLGSPPHAFHWALAKFGNSWQAVSMGNKDAQRPEKKKPKKKKT
jgi:hypothetical protein